MADDKQKAAMKAAKSEERAAKRAKRKQTWSQFWQAFNLQRKQDKKLIPLMLLAIVGMGVAFFLIGLLFNGQWFMLSLGLGLGFVLAMYIFSKRLEGSMYDRVGDTPGAAGWTLENMRNTVGIVWHTKTAVAMNTHMDTVHRVVGNPGVVLVGEGEPHRVKPLINQQRKRISRLAGDVPIYEVLVGEGEGQVTLKKLQRELLKLPRNYKKDEVYAVNAKIEAMDRIGSGNPGAGLPKGPLPKAANMSGMNRRLKRANKGKGGNT
ncbi:DUF4191 domain-containing protein [Corynebacterium testudinoris]|uniref:Putative DUF4191 family protein n=1 Tax=Corynebacterium testudinoris TaxID=136857 RepID=A0A0G3HBF6_9CORY|nr:DUF4191 domain-containing protein [Corynebacterium testudinoris]AKK09263.1 putative DUF4191 family protein [Corynebacterium testudinoris]MBX8995953.1 DUF4191 domain-containing protein [Corynebacterium testudinoris]